MQLLNIHVLNSFNSDKRQEFNDYEDITGTDISNMDLSVNPENDINLQVPQEGLERINVDVAVVEAARFHVTKGDLTCIDQSAKEHRSKMEISADLVDNLSIDFCDNVDDEQMDWKELIERHNAYVRNRDQQIGDQHRH